MQSKISILLLNYNGKKFNQFCIASILTQTYQHFEIFFIDNASTDGSVEEVEQKFKKEIQSGKISIVRNGKNEGFANGNNIGHKLASPQSKYICLLNNDTTVEENWLEELVRVIESDTTLGAVGSGNLDQGHEKFLQTMIAKGEIGNLTVLGEYSLKKTSLTKGYFYTTALSGNALLYKKTIVDEPFPSRYFAYAEDVFLNLYLLSRGWKMGYCPASIVHHYGSGSFGKKPSDFKLFYGNRNTIVNFLLFYEVKTIVKLFPLFLLTQLGHLFFNAPRKRLKAKLKARGWIFGHWNQIKSLRNKVQKDKKLTDSELLSLLSKDMVSPEVNYGTLSKGQKKMINKINQLFTWYCKIL